MPKDEIDKRVRNAARILDLEPLLKRKPRALSGGQRQRVAMGRAIVRQPAAFLMDEPLSNLDAKLRVHMRAEISRLQSDLDTTTIYVTHDQVEAMTMGDQVAVMRKGELQQVDEPQTLYDRPLNLFVAGFIGVAGDEPAGGDAPAAERGHAVAARDAAPGARPRDARRSSGSRGLRRARRDRRNPPRAPRGCRTRDGHACRPPAARQGRAPRGARLGDRRPHRDRREGGVDRGRTRARRGHGCRHRRRSRGHGEGGAPR